MKTNHNYRVSVYLGKEMFQEFEAISKLMGISIATLTKIILNTGYALSKGLDKELGKGVKNGKNEQPKE